MDREQMLSNFVSSILRSGGCGYREEVVVNYAARCVSLVMKQREKWREDDRKIEEEMEKVSV